MLNPERYVDNIFLRFLECYILKAIGELSAAEEKLIDQATPHLRKAFGANGTWEEVVASQMDFDDAFKKQVVEVWIKNRDKARTNGEELVPQDFAEMFVDYHFQQEDSDDK